MKKIPLTQGKFAIVDDTDFEYLNQYKWHYTHYGYAARDEWKPRRKIFMHREIMQTPEGMDTDHINGSGIDNRQINLRISTHAENRKNNRRAITNSSGYKGVSWDKVREKWVAYIYCGKSINLGGFETKERAAKAYNEAALRYHGKFASPNYVW